MVGLTPKKFTAVQSTSELHPPRNYKLCPLLCLIHQVIMREDITPRIEPCGTPQVSVTEEEES